MLTSTRSVCGHLGHFSHTYRTRAGYATRIHHVIALPNSSRLHPPAGALSNPSLLVKQRLSQPTRSASTVAHAMPCPHSEHPPQLYGQPLHASHPHLLEAGELTPGIQASEYAQRRKKLMDSLPAGSAVLCTSATLKYMSGRKSAFDESQIFV